MKKNTNKYGIYYIPRFLSLIYIVYFFFYLMTKMTNYLSKSNFKKQINIDLEYIKIHMGFLKKKPS